MLKIKVNLDERCYSTLLSDMKLFSIVKKDGTINKNKFMNLLFINFYDNYMERVKHMSDLASSIMQELHIDTRLANEFAMLFQGKENMEKEASYIYSITFVLTTENDYIFESIMTSFKYQTTSQFFRNLVIEYLKLPQYKREEVIFKDNVTLIQKAIEEQKMVRLFLEKETVDLAPYQLGTSKEELYLYLLGKTSKINYSVHISKIKKVILLNKPFKLLKEETELLDDIIFNGIQFPYQEPCYAEIKLTRIGKKMYERRYLHRPPVRKIEGDIYYFSCGFDHLMFYFLAFGKNAMVISPKSLERNMKYEHLNAFRLYKSE